MFDLFFLANITFQISLGCTPLSLQYFIIDGNILKFDIEPENFSYVIIDDGQNIIKSGYSGKPKSFKALGRFNLLSLSECANGINRSFILTRDVQIYETPKHWVLSHIYLLLALISVLFSALLIWKR